MFTRRREKNLDHPLPQPEVPPTGNVTKVPSLLADAANEVAREEFERVLPAATATVPEDHIKSWYIPPSQRVSRAT